MQLFFGFNVCFQVSKYIVCWFRASIFKMALYHGGENDVEFVSSCPTSIFKMALYHGGENDVSSCPTLRDPSPTPGVDGCGFGRSAYRIS
jgi:hypothetical protein